MTEYRVQLANGDAFFMAADFGRSSSPISVQWAADEDGNWQGTPYQVADANHDKKRAAELAAAYFMVDEDECTVVALIEEIKDA